MKNTKQPEGGLQIKPKYKQLSRSEQIHHVESYLQLKNEKRMSQREYVAIHKKTLSEFQLSRYLKLHNSNELTPTVERGHPKPKLFASDVENVLTKVQQERDVKKLVIDASLVKIIQETTGKQVSKTYAHSFGNKFLQKAVVQTKMVNAVREETPYEMVYRIYYFYSLFAKIVFNLRQNTARRVEGITFFDETSSEAKEKKKTRVLNKTDNGFVDGTAVPQRDTFLVGVLATGKFLPPSIVLSQEKKTKTVAGKKVLTQEKIRGVHILNTLLNG